MPTNTQQLVVSRRNLNYLLAQPNSIYACYHLPSKCLYVRYTEDIYSEYEYRGRDWALQKSITIHFNQKFDNNFQQSFNKRLLAYGKSTRDHRLRWVATPPENIPELVRNRDTVIEVPSDPTKAEEVLFQLYQAGMDNEISNSFDQFEAVLGQLSRAMDYAYLSEINLCLNGVSFDRDRVKLSINFLQDSIKRGDSPIASLNYCLGNAFFALGDHEKAYDTYCLALKQLDTSDVSFIAAQCNKNMGYLLEKSGRLDESRTYYEQALELDPDLGEAHLALALWYQKKGTDPNIALEHIDRVIQKEFSALKMTVVQGWRINILFEVGDIEGAFRDINNLLSQANQHDWIWPWCARNVAQFGKTSIESAQKSLVFWRTYLRENSQDTFAERERLLCLWFLHKSGEKTGIDFEEFKNELLKLIDDGNYDKAFLWDRIGHWAQSDNDWVNAESAFRKASELEPKRYGYCLGTALNFLKRFKEALPILLSQAKEYQPDAKSWFQVALAYEGVGDISGCISAYKRTLDLDSDDDLAWFNLGGVYWNSKDINQAKKTWDEAMMRFPNHALALKLRKELSFLFETNPD